jgi:hypothetical protein
MIQAQELRLGNYILYLDELYVVDGFKYEPNAPESKWRIMFRTINADNNARQVLTSGKMENWINPIPLTPGLLEKCGFEKMLESADPDYGPIEWTKAYAVTYQILPEYFTLWPNEGGSNGDFLLDNYSSAPLRYLHQLQNLFYALMGTELEVKL